MNSENRAFAIDFADLLNDFIGDLVTGTNVLREYNHQYRSGRITLNMMVPIQKMCLSHLVLTLSKLIEVHGKYHSIMSQEVRPVLKALNKEIRERGIGERTLWRWLKDDDFNQAYSAARRELVRSAIVQVQGGMNRAVDVLVAVMEDTASPASSRVSAAKTMLEFGVKAIELEDLEGRIAEIERSLKVIQKRKTCGI